MPERCTNPTCLEHWPAYDLNTIEGRDEYRRQIMAALDLPIVQRGSSEGVVTVDLPDKDTP